MSYEEDENPRLNIEELFETKQKTDFNRLQVFNKLANSGILVRQMDVYNIKNSLRVTIGNSYENKKLILTLKKIFNV